MIKHVNETQKLLDEGMFGELLNTEFTREAPPDTPLDNQTAVESDSRTHNAEPDQIPMNLPPIGS